MPTRVGERKRIIKLYTVPKVPDGQGGYKKGDPQYIRTAWAKVLKPKFWQVNAEGSPASSITQGFTIRYCEDVDRGWLVMFGKIMHKILHIDYSDPEEITLTCQAVKYNG